MSIEAMKRALEALEYYRSYEGIRSTPASEAMLVLRQAVEQAEKQEPVGFVHPEDLQSVTLGHNSYAAIYVETEGHTGGIPLYTALPQREWIGLTDEEIFALDDENRLDTYALARAIEAKLKEKNT